MHAFQSLAHRAPPATRTRVRWQPYGAMPTPSSLTRSPSSNDLRSQFAVPSTPAKHTEQATHIPKNSHSKESSRDPSKANFNLGLVDKAVKSLCEIWRPQDIPSVFAPSRALAIMGAAPEQGFHPSKIANIPFPTPPSPFTQPSPPVGNAATSTEKFSQCTAVSPSPLVPLRSFVHEVLRRSRTSGCVLQTALCYLEAIRPKVPELVRQEASGLFTIRPASDERIITATAEELTFEIEKNLEGGTIKSYDIMDTVRIRDDKPLPVGDIVANTSVAILEDGPQPRLPSPLLCPRRTFLASLILASKFIQDKCYSNRAWAKLSGLPAREISRCERALGEALEWRLWVGKRPQATSPVSTQLVANHRSLARSQSMSSLVDHASCSASFLLPIHRIETPVALSNNTGLRRCATLPTDVGHSVPGHHTGASLSTRQSSHGDICYPTLIDAKPTTTRSTSLSRSDDVSSCSSSPETPGLTYSPLSESSSGEVQMSALEDSLLPTTSAWAWETPDLTTCLPKTPSPTDFTMKYLACPVAAPFAEMVSALTKVEELQYPQPWVMSDDVTFCQMTSFPSI